MEQDDNEPYVTVLQGQHNCWFAAIMEWSKVVDGYVVSASRPLRTIKSEAMQDAVTMAGGKMEVRA